MSGTTSRPLHFFVELAQNVCLDDVVCPRDTVLDSVVLLHINNEIFDIGEIDFCLKRSV